MHTVNFEETIEKIVANDARFHRDAYVFLREALDHTQKSSGKGRKDESKHVSGQELLGGIRDYALEQFGPMALAVLQEWGVSRCEDFGEIVFNMVKSGLLKKEEKDSPADFSGGYDFQEAFRTPFLPAKKVPVPAVEVKSA